MKKGLLGLGAATLATLLLVGCSNGESKDSGKETITFINHRTDWETNGKWDEYIKQFNEKILISKLRSKRSQTMRVKLKLV